MKRLLSLWNRYVRFVQFRSHKATFIDYVYIIFANVFTLAFLFHIFFLTLTIYNYIAMFLIMGLLVYIESSEIKKWKKIQKDKSYKMKNIMLILEFLLILTFMIASIYLMTNAIIVGVFAHIFFISFCLWWVYEIYGLWKDFFNRIKNEKNT